MKRITNTGPGIIGVAWRTEAVTKTLVAGRMQESTSVDSQSLPLSPGESCNVPDHAQTFDPASGLLLDDAGAPKRRRFDDEDAAKAVLRGGGVEKTVIDGVARDGKGELLVEDVKVEAGGR